MIPTVDNSHTAEAKAKLSDFFRSKANITAILAALTDKIQEIEGMLWNVINLRLFTAPPTGDYLERVGAIVGEDRLGRTDGDYFNAVKLRIRVNLSKGRAEDLIQIANLLTPSSYDEFPPYRFLVTSFNLAATVGVTTFCRLLAEAKALGSRGVLHFTVWPASQNLVFGSVHGGVSSVNTITSVRATVGVPPNLGKVCSSRKVA